MIAPILFLILTVILWSMYVAYQRTQDPLHPLMFLGPMLAYIYVAQPAPLLWRGELQAFLTDGQIQFAGVLFASGIVLLCAGVVNGSGPVSGKIHFYASTEVERRLVILGCFLGCLSVASYSFAVFRSGGFLSVYGHAKGHYSAGSGWVNELVNLSIPAAALLMLAWKGRRQKWHYLALAVVWASPLLVHGLLGARRGPTFIIFATLIVAWLISSKRKVSLWKVMSRFGSLGLLILFLVAHRDQIYLGNTPDFGADKVVERILSSDANEANDTVFMYGLPNAIEDTGTHYWGMRYAATYFVRPIPRQLWPTKYEDVGLAWMVDQRAVAGISDSGWLGSVGWLPVTGSAPGFVADLYQEFSWAGLVGCYFLGWFFGWLWRKAAANSGVWVLLYIQAAALSVYVPTQSVSAVFHRFLLMAVPTLILWHWYIGRSSAKRPPAPRVKVYADGCRHGQKQYSSPNQRLPKGFS